MAQAKTYEWDKITGYIPASEGCAICGKTPDFRAFYYPTFMNGDAEWLGDYCPEHKGTNLKKVQSQEIKTLYWNKIKKSW